MAIKGIAKNKKNLKILGICLLAACVLCAGGFGIWWIATAPEGAVDPNGLTQSDINALYRQKNTRKHNLPGRLETLLGLQDTDTIVSNGNRYDDVLLPDGSAAVQDNGKAVFSDREWLLTDADTYERLRKEIDLQRGLQIRALLKLALTQNCERVRFSVEYVELGENATLAEYIAANGGAGNVRGQGGYTLEYSEAWATRTIGKDIKSVATDKDTFAAFVKELEHYTAAQATVVPGAGRG